MSFEGHIHHIMASSASCIRFQRHRQGMARRVWAGEKGVPLSRSYCRFYRSGGWSSFRMVSPWFVVYPPPVLGQSMTNPSITLYCCFIISHLSRYIPVIFPLCKKKYIYILQIPQVYASITIGNLDAMGTPLGSLKDIVPHLKLTHLDPDLWCNHGDPTGSPGTSGASSSSGIPFTDFERLVNDAWRKNHRDGSSICKNSHGEELVLYCWGLHCYVPSVGGVTIARSFKS